MHGSLSIPFCYRANIYALCELQTLLVQSMACTLSLQQLGSDTILALQKVRLLLLNIGFFVSHQAEHSSPLMSLQSMCLCAQAQL